MWKSLIVPHLRVCYKLAASSVPNRTLITFGSIHIHYMHRWLQEVTMIDGTLGGRKYVHSFSSHVCGFSRGGIIAAGFLKPSVSCLWCVLCVTNKQLSTSWQRKKKEALAKWFVCMLLIQNMISFFCSCASEILRGHEHLIRKCYQFGYRYMKKLNVSCRMLNEWPTKEIWELQEQDPNKDVFFTVIQSCVAIHNGLFLHVIR